MAPWKAPYMAMKGSLYANGKTTIQFQVMNMCVCGVVCVWLRLWLIL